MYFFVMNYSKNTFMYFSYPEEVSKYLKEIAESGENKDEYEVLIASDDNRYVADEFDKIWMRD